MKKREKDGEIVILYQQSKYNYKEGVWSNVTIMQTKPEIRRKMLQVTKMKETR